MLAKCQTTTSRVALASSRARAVVARPARRSTVSVAASHGTGLPIDLRGASLRGPHWARGEGRCVLGALFSLSFSSSRARLSPPSPRSRSSPKTHRQEGVHCRRCRRPGAFHWRGVQPWTTNGRAEDGPTTPSTPSLSLLAHSPLWIALSLTPRKQPQGFGWAIAKALAEAGAEISLGVWVSRSPVSRAPLGGSPLSPARRERARRRAERAAPAPAPSSCLLPPPNPKTHLPIR